MGQDGQVLPSQAKRARCPGAGSLAEVAGASD